MPTDAQVLTYLLQAFIRSFSLGSALVIEDALALLGLLTGLEIAVLAVRGLWDRTINVKELVGVAIAVNVLAWMITGWQSLTRAVINTFIYFGLKSGGDAISQTDFTNPSNIAQYGMNVAAVINQHLSQPEYMGWGALWNIREIILSGWLGIIIAVLYFLLAIAIFVVLLEFYATTAFTVVLLPFGAHRLTAFLAEKTFSALCASGIQVMALSFITSAALPVMVALQGGMHPTLDSLLVQLLGAMALLFLAWRVHKVAQVISSGSPQLTLNDVSTMVLTTMTVMSTATSAMVSARNAFQSALGMGAAGDNSMPRRRI